MDEVTVLEFSVALGSWSQHAGAALVARTDEATMVEFEVRVGQWGNGLGEQVIET